MIQQVCYEREWMNLLCFAQVEMTISSIKLNSAKLVPVLPVPRMKNALLKSSGFIATPSNEVFWLFTKHRSALPETSCLILSGSSPISPSLITLNLQTNKPKMLQQTTKLKTSFILLSPSSFLMYTLYIYIWMFLQYDAKRSAYWKWTRRLKATPAIIFELLYQKEVIKYHKL